ncbi:MAG: 1-acyl-sn-glycerol-3-phosphate acyltransferase, partial [Candidatus Competibacterales bacterium]|nr:1-acyl-sn-glycerol-3-phosphate acyltransferase [Candidatus Competibacterales bacterium]
TLLGAGLSIPQLFLLLAILNAAVAVYIYTLVPEFLLRFLVWMLIHLIYRVRKQGLEQIPEDGPALLVCNHVSYVDALIIAGCIRRPVRFVMDHRIFRVPVLSFLFRTAGAIPIAPARENAELLERAYRRIGRRLDAGELVCVFPEGRLTPDGDIQPFKRGIERMLRTHPVPVVPLALRGLWGSPFSRCHAGLRGWLPRGLWPRIGLQVGTPMPAAETDAAVLQERVAELRGEYP